jgi:dipeptidyl aminopeptidase/acylaminoacyl peptidase
VRRILAATALVVVLAVAGPAAAAGLRERAEAIPASGGVRLAGALTLPAGNGPFPAVVLVSGFGPVDRDGGFGLFHSHYYRTLATALARRGVAVLRYDKRGIGDSGGSALAWLNGPLLIRDVEAAERDLAHQPSVDPGRIGLIGHSQGGDLVFQAARELPGVRRVVTLAAPGRPLVAIDSRANLVKRVVGPRIAAATIGVNPLPIAAAVRQPTLLLQGSADHTVPPVDLDRLAAARRAAGRPTVTVRVPGAGHDITVHGRLPPWVLDRIAGFLRR